MTCIVMHMIRAAVAGASGYAGGEVVRLLLAAPATSRSGPHRLVNAGQPLGSIHPHLTPLADRLLEDTTPEVLAGHDAVVLALPHGHSGALAAQLARRRRRHRLRRRLPARRRGAWTSFYDTPYAGSWPYGMPELPTAGGPQRTRSPVPPASPCRGATRPRSRSPSPPASSPACSSPTTSSSSRHPARRAPAGRSSRTCSAAEVMGAMSPYGVGGVHRHTPEIEQNLTAAGAGPVTVSFTPTLAPMPRGILATCTARVRPGTTPRPCARPGRPPTPTSPSCTCCPRAAGRAPAASLGSNAVHLQVALDERVGRVVVVAAIDNLTKGTAGAAVQCPNLALGLRRPPAPDRGVAP